MTHVTLYVKTDCHLCDLAIKLLEQFDLSVSVIDIQSETELMEQYGLVIPVVHFENGATLNWPFDATAIQSQLSA